MHVCKGRIRHRAKLERTVFSIGKHTRSDCCELSGSCQPSGYAVFGKISRRVIGESIDGKLRYASEKFRRDFSLAYTVVLIDVYSNAILYFLIFL